MCRFDFATVHFDHCVVSEVEPTVEMLLRLLAERDALIAAEAETIAMLQATVVRLEGRVAELEARLGMNSTNSHLPPSSDGPGKPVKPAPRSLRRKSGKKPGGQPGHEGRTLSMTDDPDEVVRHAPQRCAGCGTGRPLAVATPAARCPGGPDRRAGVGGRRAVDHFCWVHCGGNGRQIPNAIPSQDYVHGFAAARAVAVPHTATASPVLWLP